MAVTLTGRARRSTAWGWLLALALQAALVLTYGGLWLVAARSNLFARADFTAFYSGWSIVRDGLAGRLYDLPTQASYQQPLLGGERFADGVLPYINPPHLTLPFVPLAWLPAPAAFAVWTLVQLGLVAWLLRWLVREVAGDWSARERWLLVGGVLSFPSLFFDLLLGAFSLLVLVSLAQVYRHVRERRAGLAGAWLVIGTIKPQAMLLPAALLLAARRWRTLAAAAALGGALTLIAGVVLGWETLGQYVGLVQHHGTLFKRMGVDPSIMWNARGTLTLLLGEDRATLINQVSGLVLLGATGAALWLGHGARPASGERFDLQMAVTVLLGVLASPHVNPHDGLLLVLPAALGYRALRRDERQRGPYAALVLACPLLFLVAEFTVGGRLGVRVPVLAAVALTVWLAVALRRLRVAGD